MQISVQTTKPKEVVDITELVQREIGKNGIQNGWCMLFVKHTTVSLTTADLDPGTDLDMLDAFEQIVPKLHYRHPHDPKHVPDHIMSSIIGPSVMVPVQNGSLDMGTWQRIVLIELNGPKERNVVMSFIQG